MTKTITLPSLGFVLGTTGIPEHQGLVSLDELIVIHDPGCCGDRA